MANLKSTLPVGIALGSNQGDRAAELDAAVAFLRSISAGHELRPSSRVETAPVDCPPGSATFLNAVVEIQLDPKHLPPRNLMHLLQKFEQSRGRAAEREINAPRPLDLDLIFYGEIVFTAPDLEIPHPRAHLRRFVLEPLAELRADLVLPGQAKTVLELLDAMLV